MFHRRECFFWIVLEKTVGFDRRLVLVGIWVPGVIHLLNWTKKWIISYFKTNYFIRYCGSVNHYTVTWNFHFIYEEDDISWDKFWLVDLFRVVKILVSIHEDWLWFKKFGFLGAYFLYGTCRMLHAWMLTGFRGRINLEYSFLGELKRLQWGM